MSDKQCSMSCIVMPSKNNKTHQIAACVLSEENKKANAKQMREAALNSLKQNGLHTKDVFMIIEKNNDKEKIINLNTPTDNQVLSAGLTSPNKRISAIWMYAQKK